MDLLEIEELKKEDFNDFLHYLTIHLSENGDNNLFFQPLSKEQSKLGPEWEEKFKTGFSKKFGEVGWRKLWIARNEAGQIVGHVDIRSRTELNTEHRVLLGMGTDSKFRNLKIGQRLLQFVIKYCKNQPEISWIDLDVLTINIPAIRLYERSEFQTLSRINDMFRIDNHSYGYLSMTLNVESEVRVKRYADSCDLPGLIDKNN